MGLKTKPDYVYRLFYEHLYLEYTVAPNIEGVRKAYESRPPICPPPLRKVNIWGASFILWLAPDQDPVMS